MLCAILAAHLLADTVGMAAPEGYLLYNAANRGRASAVADLVHAGADINFKDGHGFTPLIAASTKGHGSCVALLVEKGAELNHANVAGKTPLLAAAANGHAHVMRILLEAGAAVGIRDSAGRTVKDYCKGSRSKQRECAQVLSAFLDEARAAYDEIAERPGTLLVEQPDGNVTAAVFKAPAPAEDPNGEAERRQVQQKTYAEAWRDAVQAFML